MHLNGFERRLPYKPENHGPFVWPEGEANYVKEIRNCHNIADILNQIKLEVDHLLDVLALEQLVLNVGLFTYDFQQAN